MLRVISGTFKGRKLFAPRSRSVRPTSDRVKEALFQILGPFVEGASVLDLYAGSGNLGFEALSRGALRCCFVERDPACCAVIDKNVERLELQAVSRVMRFECTRAVRILSARAERFDLVLVDPPYRKSEGRESELKKILRALDRYVKFAPRAMVVTEHFKNDQPPSDLKRLNLKMQRRYGDTMLSFFSAVTKHKETI
jgi:16S rRNA (guanine(966)-N(2))-methyltransferase RsmD